MRGFNLLERLLGWNTETIAPPSVRPRLVFRYGYYFCQSPESPWRGFGATAEEAYQSWLSAISAQARGQMPRGNVLTVWSAVK